MASSEMEGERQGILTFFSQNIRHAKTKNISPDESQLGVVIDLEKPDENENELIEPVDTLDSTGDATIAKVYGIDGIEDDVKIEKTKKKELAALKREELKREKELKRKLREEEKRQRDTLKEEQKRQREQQREDERHKREERKKEKELQRQEAKKQKELEKTQKELEKQKKEEAKQRAQSRIGSFFKKVSDSSKESNDKSDYQKYFLPFYAKDGVVLPRDQPLHSSFERQRNDVDQQLGQRESADDAILDWLASKSVKRGGRVTFTAVSLLQQMTSKEKEDEELQSLLKMIPQKYIKFYENVRPPYIGTYSKDVILPAENPFSTEETGYDYGYDSDLDWINEEDEEGEQGGVDNLESGEDDEDEEEEEASEGEFEGFLDAEDGSNKSRSAGKRKFIGPLIPTVHLRSKLNDLDEDDKKYFEAVKVEYLIEQQPFPIDPHTSVGRSQSSNNLKRLAEADQDPESSSNSPSVSPEKKRVKALITETTHLLKLFNEIHDSTFSLGTVTEIAQKNLPQYSKQTIKNTVKEYAVRGTGKGDLGRKWVIRDMKHWEDLRSL